MYPFWLFIAVAAASRRYIFGKSLSVLKVPLAITMVITIVVYLLLMIYCFPGTSPMNYEPNNVLAFINPSYTLLVNKVIYRSIL